MQKDLSAYVKQYDSWFDSNACEQTLFELQNADWQSHTFYDNVTKRSETKSGSKELDTAYHTTSTKDYLMQRMWDGYHRYITELDFRCFGYWTGFTQIKFNLYKTGRVMAEHCDHISTIFDGETRGIPILTALGALNDDYEGGNFVMWGDTPFRLKRGDLLIFPSNFLYPHKVEQVTKGSRYTFVTWCW